jgi:formylglycine-generating enzyme required for sulfatase activity
MKAILALVLLPLIAIAQEQAPANVSTNKPDLKKLLELPEFTNSIGMVMVRISPTLWAGKYPVTQAEYQAAGMGNPSQFRGGRNPVDSVSWSDAQAWCAQLNRKEKQEEFLPEGFRYALPTQAEWEILMNGATLADAVTSQGATRSSTAPVGSLRPNRLGLYDTRGNVWQFCADPEDKPYRVLRGGAWDTAIDVNLRPEFRWYSSGPFDKKNNYGFRCVLKP